MQFMKIKNIFALILLQLCPVFSNNVTMDKKFRLFPEVIPYNYDLSIVTHLGDSGDFSFNGVVKITIASKVKNIKVIKINSKNLNISKQLTRINHSSKKEIKVKITNHKINTATDFYVIYLNKPLIANEMYVLSITFAGALTDNLIGYYRSHYIDSTTGETRWLAATQFQPTHARRAFPCFDEPSFKATFRITLIHMDKYTSVSNMPLLLSEEIEPGWVKNTFKLSEKMSTYTVAYVVSEFKHLDLKIMNNKILFRVWTQPAEMNRSVFALGVGPKLLKYYEEYFQLPYPMEKLDIFAIPDFLLHGMENWGLILFRESLLLTDLQTGNALPHSECATLISHEIAHQWFGNLVTMKWWTETWLNEGFASHMESKAVDQLFPQWNALLSDTLEKMHTVLNIDGLVESHPVFIPISHPGEIVRAFDDISYKKGSILIRMINIILGEEAFRSGMSSYLKNLSFLNADKEDLWEHLTSNAHTHVALSTNTSIKEIMDPWLVQSGYPIVTVTRDYIKGTIRLNQRKFLFMQEHDHLEISNDCWSIPISYTTRKIQNFYNTKPHMWLTCENNNSTFRTEAKKYEWIILNIQLSGLYRVQYDLNNWNLISNALLRNHTTIDVMNKAQLIFDVLDFAWIGKLEYKTAFSLVSYLRKEENYFPWNVFLNKIQKVYLLLRQLNNLTAFRELMSHLMEPIYKEWSDFYKEIAFNDLQSPKLRNKILDAACKYQIFDCVSTAKVLLNTFMQSSIRSYNLPSQSLLQTMFCNGIRNSGESEWNSLWNLYVNSKNTHLLQALTCTKNTELLQRLLNTSHSSSGVIRQQESANVFSSIATDNEVGFLVAKNFYMQNINKLFSFFRAREYYLGSYLEILAMSMVTEDQLKEVSKFINNNKRFLKYSSTSVNKALNVVKQNIEWYKSRYNDFLSAAVVKKN